MIEGEGFALFWAELMKTFELERLPGDLGEWASSLSRPRQEILLRYWDSLLRLPVERMQAYLDRHLRAISAPFVAIHGKLPEAGYDAWLRARIAQAEIVVLGAACHMPQLVAPDLLVDTVKRLAA
jgi:pimeloyl-ACP methyl ester carboxylesterase